MGIKGLWSVIIIKCSNPARNMLHLDTAQATARSSNSNDRVARFCAAQKRDPACIRAHCPSDACCCRMKPMPCLLASVQIRVGFSLSKNAGLVLLPDALSPSPVLLHV